MAIVNPQRDRKGRFAATGRTVAPTAAKYPSSASRAPQSPLNAPVAGSETKRYQEILDRAGVSHGGTPVAAPDEPENTREVSPSDLRVLLPQARARTTPVMQAPVIGLMRYYQWVGSRGPGWDDLDAVLEPAGDTAHLLKTFDWQGADDAAPAEIDRALDPVRRFIRGSGADDVEVLGFGPLKR